MPGYRSSALGLLLLASTLLGCNGGKASAPPSQPQQQTNVSAPAASAGTLAGRWKLSFNQTAYTLDLCLLDIAEAGDGFDVKLVALAPQFGAATLKTAEATKGADESKVIVKFDTPQGSALNFEGTLRGKEVWGSLLVPGITLATAKMVSAAESSLEETTPRPLPHYEDFTTALQTKDPAAFMSEFIKAYSTSPLALDGYNVMFMLAKSEKFSEAQLQDFLDRELKVAGQWGPLTQHKVYFEVGGILARQDYLPDFAMKLLTQAASYLTPESPEEWRRLLGEGYINLGKAEEGVALLRPIHERRSSDMRVTYGLAKGLEKTGESDKALELYADLAVMPVPEGQMMQLTGGAAEQLPTERVAQLWKEKHGNTDGLDAFLKEAEKKGLARYVRERKDPAPPDEGTRVAFLEVFTGATCGPCVSADVAATALQSAYSPKEVVMVQYHQHIPSFSPLPNDDSVRRAAYYKLPTTPHVLINGVDSVADGYGVGGDLDRAAAVCHALQAEVDKIIATKTDLRLQLSAKAENGIIKIAANATGMDAFPDTHRLRLALVEDEIEFVAPNGIRTHTHVVRKMPGGADGISPKEGKLSFETETSVADVKAGLEKHLAAVEEKYRTEFPVKPLALKAFHLVAFVQNDETNDVLQAAMVPVEGDLAIPEQAADKPAEGASESKP